MKTQPTVLLVEAQKHYREYMQFLLESAGYKVVSAKTTEQTLTTLEQSAFDYILADNLPAARSDRDMQMAGETGKWMAFTRLLKIAEEQ